MHDPVVTDTARHYYQEAVAAAKEEHLTRLVDDYILLTERGSP